MCPRLTGQPIKRKEDRRLLTGAATYVDDLTLPGMLYAAFVRSPLAHAAIKRIDVSSALRRGAIKALTGAELKELCGPLVVNSVQKGSKVPEHYPLAVGEAKFVGEPVAVVVARDRYAARDAAEEVVVEYEPLPAVVDPERAMERGAPLVHRELGDNICYTWRMRRGDVDGIFRRADRVVASKLRIRRLSPTPIEPRGVVAQYDAASGRLTVWGSTQFPHSLQGWIASSLRMDESRVRVIVPEVGGGFGAKLNHYPEDVVIPLLAMQLGRPVKWVEDRRENFLATTHGRGMTADIEAAFSGDGRILALRGRIIADLGAYNYVSTQLIPILAASMLPGAYRMEGIDAEVVGVFTNKMATDAYRGAGRPEAAYIIERVMDRAARSLGIDPAELRLKNFIRPSEFPYKTPTGFEYDSGDYEAALRRALELAGYEELRREREGLRREGRYMGIGVSTFVEICNFRYQGAHIKVEPDGRVLAFTSTSPHGQGEETAFAQLIADELGIRLEDVEVIHGDTLLTPRGSGTAGSWTLTSGGNALLIAARQVREKTQAIAAAMLEARPEDLSLGDGWIWVKGAPDKRIAFSEVARVAYDQDRVPEGLEVGLAATGFYTPNVTSPFGAYVAVVEVDPETWGVELRRVVLVSDCGRVVNPMLVEGQIHGGAVQALGQALLEEVIYGDDGSQLTASLMDYLIPSAREVPELITDRTETPAPNPLGTKGVGELATIGLTPAILNAVEDALSPLGVPIDDIPAKPSYLYSIARGAGGGRRA